MSLSMPRGKYCVARPLSPHQLFLNQPPNWMKKNRTKYYDLVSGLLLRATLTGCCGGHTPSVHWAKAVKPDPGLKAFF